MNYLFFDIECSDGVHICSLGYLKTDSHFNRLSKKDILINPECKFHLGPKGNPQILLSYPQKMFYNQSNFVSHYNRIKRLLLDKNNFLIGFSITNDFNFINLACERYHLQQLQLKGLDVQQLHKLLTHQPTVASLEKVADYYNIKLINLHLHKSCDDAQLTMLILKKILNTFNLTMKDIMERYPSTIVSSKKYVRKNKPSHTTKHSNITTQTRTDKKIVIV